MSYKKVAKNIENWRGFFSDNFDHFGTQKLTFLLFFVVDISRIFGHSWLVNLLLVFLGSFLIFGDPKIAIFAHILPMLWPFLVNVFAVSISVIHIICISVG